MKKLLALGALAILFVLAVFGRSLAVSDINYSVSSNYKVASDGTSTVSHVINAKNATTNKTPSVIKIPVAGDEVSSVVAKVNDGDVAATISGNGSTINVKLPDLAGKDKTWKLTLNYKSKLVSELGKAKVLQIPTLSGIGLAITSQKTVVSADLSIGLAVALPAPPKTDIAVGEQIFTYDNKTGPVADAITLLISDNATATVNVTKELKNNGWWWKTVELTLPPDTNQQQVILSSLEPKPSNVRLDRDGNILAQYRLGPKKSVTVSAKALVSVKNLSYTLDTKKTVNEIDQSLKDLYTAQTDKWSGGKIELNVNPVASVPEVVQTVYDAVVKQARAETALSDNQELSQTNIDELGKYADLLIGELRANGVPARAVLGKLVSDGQFILSDSRGHTWAEAYIPDTGWITLDPALAVYGDYFSSSDILHVGLALWGVSDYLPPIDLASVNVTYSLDAFEVPEATPVLSAVKTVIFPGISILKVSVEMPPGVITDGNAFEYGGQIQTLGSLAPLQTAEAKALRFGAAAFSGEEVKYGYSDGSALTTGIATAESSMNYKVLITEAILLILGIVLFFFMRRRRAANKYKPSKDSLVMHDEDDGGDVQEADLVGSKPIVDEVADTPKPSPPILPNEPAPQTTIRPPVTRGTINAQGNGNSFQKPSAQNPRRHIVQ